jgi:hypothetical protein
MSDRVRATASTSTRRKLAWLLVAVTLATALHQHPSAAARPTSPVKLKAHVSNPDVCELCRHYTGALRVSPPARPIVTSLQRQLVAPPRQLARMFRSQRGRCRAPPQA